MNIGIDCRLSGHTHAGIGRYIENLAQRLPELRPDIHWTYFFSTQEQADVVLSALPKHDHVSIVIVPIRHYSLAEQLKLPTIFNSAKLDLLHVPHFNIPLFYNRPLAVTIHDLLWHEYKGTKVTTLQPWKYWLKYAGYRHVASQAVKKARIIFVPAQTIKKTLLSYYPETQSKIIVTKEGASVATSSSKGSQPDQDRLHKLLPAHIRHQPFFVYVGSLYPHKNVKLVISALQYLPQHRLVIVGSRTVFQDQIRTYVQERGVENQVHFAGYLTDDELAVVYEKALALVQPSLSEGFGLTGVEAMAQKVPVLASNIPIFKEIYQNGAFFFDPLKPRSFVTAVEKLTKANRSSIIKKGLEIAQTYSWDTMTEQTLAGYLKALQP